MCLENFPECGDGGDGCCKIQLGLAFGCAGKKVPPIHYKEVDFQLYTLWCELDGKRIADCIEACCPVCAEAEFIFKHLCSKGLDKGLDELNRLYSLPDTRTENR
jgi:hypothetical protein